jgi:hypothetical protein
MEMVVLLPTCTVPKSMFGDDAFMTGGMLLT